MKKICTAIAIFLLSSPAFAATNVPFTIAMSEAVNVTGSPRIAVDVGGVTRYATYASGTGTSSLTFTYAAQAGDVDLDGVTLSSPIDLNGGTITDLNGNPETNLTFTVPNTSGIKIDYPSLSMDFIADADGRYTLNGTAYNDLPAFLSATGGTFARNSVATYYDSTGTLQTAAANQPRFDHDPVTLQPKGILIEESRMNYVVNSEFQGASVGVSPTNITITGGGPGVSASVTAVGILNGEKYLEVTFSGTNSSGSSIFPNIALASNVPAVQGQTWTQRVHTISHTGTGPGFSMEMAELTSSNGGLNYYYSPLVSNTYQRHTRTLMNANCAKIRFLILATVPAGQSINRVLRISVPQLEQGAFPTSYIPTTSAAVTRDKDVLSVPHTSWFDTNQGSWYAQAHASPNPGNGRIIGTNVGATNFIGWSNTTGSTVESWNGTNNLTALVSPAASSTTTAKLALSYNNTSPARSLVANGGSVSTSATSVTTGSTVFLGSTNGINSLLNSTISNVKYYPARISDTQLQLLTQ